jgi:hypothetical protein
MRALKRSRDVSPRLNGSFESLLAQFSATTLELNPSLGAAEFSRRLTARAAEMLGARASVLAIASDAEWQIAALSGPAHRWDPMTQHHLAGVLAEQASVPGEKLREASAVMLLGRGLADALVWEELVLARLSGSQGELLGVLCLADVARELSATERQLLEALAGHAAMALENVRLFSRVEQSKISTPSPISSSCTTPEIASCASIAPWPKRSDCALPKPSATKLIVSKFSTRRPRKGIAPSAEIRGSRTKNSSTKLPSAPF